MQMQKDLIKEVEEILKEEFGGRGEKILDDVFEQCEDELDLFKLEDILYLKIKEIGYDIQRAEMVVDKIKKIRFSQELKKPSTDDRDELQILKKIGDVCVNLDELEEAEQHYQKMYSLSEERGQNGSVICALESLAELYLLKDKIEVVERNANEMIKRAKVLGEETLEAKGIKIAGIAAWRKHDGKEALNYLERALEIFKKKGMREEMGKVRRDMGDIYIDLGELQDGIEFYRKAADDFRGVGLNYERVSLLMEIGMILSDTGDYETAIKFLEKAQKESEEHLFNNHKAWCLFNLGELFLEKERYEEAENALKEAVELFVIQEDIHGEAGAKMAYGRWLLEKGKLEEAEYLFKEALNIFKKTGLLESQLSVHQYLSRIHKKKGNLKDARAELERSLQLADVLDLEDLKESIGKELEEISD